MLGEVLVVLRETGGGLSEEGGEEENAEQDAEPVLAQCPHPGHRPLKAMVIIAASPPASTPIQDQNTTASPAVPPLPSPLMATPRPSGSPVGCMSPQP